MPVPESAPRSAASLGERLEHPDELPRHVDPGPADTAAADRWRRSAARDDEDAFADRLSIWTTGDPVEYVARLRGAPARSGVPAVLRELAAPPRRRSQGRGELPEITGPLIHRGWELIGPHDAATPSACSDLSAGLEHSLVRLLQTVVDTEYRRFRQHSVSGRNEFMMSLTAQSCERLWWDYPVLARLVAATVTNWASATHHLLARFAADRTDLATLVGASRVGDISSVSAGLSDPHNGGCQVVVVTIGTDSGTRRIVYKPKDLSSEQLLADVIDWANGHGLDLGPPTRVVTRHHYGWTEFVETAPTADPKRYFRRAGCLAAILFALGGNDCHAQNMIARGDQPVIIDAETVLQPGIAPEDGSAGPPDNVLDTLILPRWLRIGGRAVELSALGAGAAGEQWRRRVLRWQDARTDEARLVPAHVVTDLAATAARDMDGSPYAPHDHSDELLEGFDQAWRVLAQDAESLLSGPLAGLAEARVRVLVRMTRTYTRIADTSLVPDLLVDGLARSSHLEHLARHVLDRDDWRTALPVIDAERDQMEDGDIPFFTVRGCDSRLSDAGGEPVLPFIESAQARALRRLRALGHRQWMTQSDLIHTSLALAPRGVRAELLNAGPAMADPAHPPAPESVRRAAGGLADMCLRQLSAGLTLTAADPEQWAVSAPTVGWYDGTTGLAVALAAAGKALGRSDATDEAVRLLTVDLAEARRRGNRLWRGRGVGGQDGVGGLLVGWAALADLLPDQGHAIEAAVHDLLAGCGPLPREQGHDLLEGTLGLLAGICALDSSGIGIDPGFAGGITDHVVDCVGAYQTGPQFNGFAHGNAGMAAVLSAAVRREWGADPFATAQLVRTLIAAESDRFDESLADWPDLRKEGAARPGPGWCNGAPGIALSRAVTGDRSDLSRCLPMLVDDVLPRDTLCCGAAGRAEVLRALAAAGAVSGAEAGRAVAGLVERLDAGQLRLGVPTDSRLQPLGLFQGIAGPLYALSAWLEPSFPPILTWGATRDLPL